ncbi:hypothetical protein EBS02_03280 [bacterium]|nr:hypothetical protein [bacterium]
MIKKFNSFRLNEDVNKDLSTAKKLVNDQMDLIRQEISNEKSQEDPVQKINSIKKQATLYAALPALLNKLASTMDAKQKSGDKTNVY